MNVVNHRLDGLPFEPTENMGGEIDPTLLVIHYTVVRTMAATVRAFRSRASQASAHLVLDADGSLTQLVPFNRKAWHAGPSEWAGRSGCNRFSIGVELVNPGPLERRGDQYRDVNNQRWDGEVVEAKHKNGRARWSYWAAYSEAQIATLHRVGAALVQHYGLRDVVGHDDVAPARKIDPGPAFPIEGVRGLLFGRSDDGPELFETTTELNVRKGPNVSFDTVPGSPLAKAVRVRAVDQDGAWWHVMSLGSTVEGWVHGRFLVQVRSAGDGREP
jgi:N-acetylmuramoyl-L-alanine amidase